MSAVPSLAPFICIEGLGALEKIPHDPLWPPRPACTTFPRIIQRCTQSCPNMEMFSSHTALRNKQTPQVEWTTADNFGNTETKLVTLSSSVDDDTEGRFRLRFGGQATYPLQHDATAAEVENALEALATVADVDVTSSPDVLPSTSFGSAWTVTFTGVTGPLPKAGFACTACVSNIYDESGQRRVDVGSNLTGIVTVGDRISLSSFDAAAVAYTATCLLLIEEVNVEYLLASELRGSACTLIPGTGANLALSFYDPAGLAVEHVDLRSVSGTGVISAHVTELLAGTYPAVYGYAELSAEDTCSVSMLGPSSSVQRLVLSADPAVTASAGSYRLALGEHMTEDCIAYDASPTDVASALEKLPNVAGGVSVFGRVFDDNDFYYPVQDQEQVVTDGLGYDYLIRFWGPYTSKTGAWPQLRVPPEYFGRAAGSIYNCAEFTPNLNPSVHVVMLKQARTCSAGNPTTQVILAEATSELGGSFSLRRADGQLETVPLSSTAAEMEIALSDALQIAVDVTEARVGDYSKAWLVSYDAAVGDTDRLALCDRFATGSGAAVGVYDAVVVTTSAANAAGNSGQFRFLLGGEASDLVSFDASDGRVDQVLQAMMGVGKVTMLSPVDLGGSGGVDIGEVVLNPTSAAGVATGDLPKTVVATGDISKTVAPGDSAVFDGISEQYKVVTVSYESGSGTTTLTVDRDVNVSGTTTTPAVIGTAAVSRTALPGRATMVSDVSVMYSYPDVSASATFLELSAGGVAALGIDTAVNPPSPSPSPSSISIVVAGESYVAIDFASDIVTLSSPFLGPTVVAGDVEVKVFSTSMPVSFTRDISDKVVDGDALWMENADGDYDELTIVSTLVQGSSYEVSGLFSSDYDGKTAYIHGNGRTWMLAFKHTDADLDTFQVEPEADWRGLGGGIEVRRPGGIAPLTATLGSPSEVQTVALRSSESATNTGTWSLSLWPEDGPTAALSWGAADEDVAEALEALSAVSYVDVERLGDGASAEWFYGYVYTISFWGVHSSSGLPQMTVDTSLSTDVTAYVDTVRQGAAVASQTPTLVALKEGMEYSIRARAFGPEGFGPASDTVLAETPEVGVLPGPPTAVTLGSCRYSSTSLGVKWRPPLKDGGQSVDAYRIEWDRSQPISESSAAYGTDYLQVTHEVQEIMVNFRSGDSIATRGGTFSVSWGGHSTADLPWDSSASAVETAILAISGVQELAVNPIGVTRVPYRNGFRWTVTFMAWRGDLALLRGDGTLLVGDDPSLTFREKVAGRSDIYPGDYTNEVQAVTVTSLSSVEPEASATSTFTLAFEGKVVDDIDFDESAESFKAKLQAIDTIFCVDVKRYTVDGDLKLYSWYVTLAWLDGEVVPGAGNIGLLTVVDTSDLVGNGADVGVFELVAGTNPMEYTIPNLLPGVQYYAHVAAHNSRGFGDFSADATGLPQGQPGPPVDATLAIDSGSSVSASWAPPESDGGAAVSGYMVEWYTTEDPGTNEVQMITTSAKKGVSEVQTISIKADENNLGGYYKISFDGQSTGNIAWDAPATGTESVKEKLERLPGVGDVDVTQDYSRVAVAGLRVDVAVGADHATASSSLLPSQSGLVENDIVFVAGYRARVRGFGGASDGTILQFGTEANSNNADTFDDVSGEGANGVIVEKWAYGYEYTVTFSSYNGDAPLMEPSASDGWAGTNPVIDIEEVTPGLQPISGTFRLRYDRENTPPLDHDASAEEIEAALESIIDIGDVAVSKVLNGYGHNWIITFVTEMGDVDLMEADGTGLTGPSATVSVSVGQDGVLPSTYGSHVITDSSVVQYTIQGLTLGEGYSVRVRANNAEEYGYAAQATPTSIRPLEAPGVPEDVSLIVMSDAMLKLVWSAPLSNGGDTVTQYRVDWDTDADFSNLNTSGFYHILSVGDAVGPYFYNIVIPTASSWLPRYARVSAYNSFAWGEPGVPDPAGSLPALRPPGEPQSVTLAVTSGVGLAVSWEEPSTELVVFGGDGGSAIEEYLVEWDASAKFDSPSRRAVVTMPSALSHLIGGRDLMTGEESDELEPGMTYYARVSAFNAQGYGAVVPTEPSSAMTEDQVPASPEILGGETDGPTSVAGWLSPPERDGGETLTKYRMEWDVSEDFSHINGSSRAGGWEDVPLVQEKQAFAVSSSVGQEEQWIMATVEVTNERQTVRTQVSTRNRQGTRATSA